MSPEERQAQLLAEWMQSPVGTAPPADVDPDVLQAIYALRPELAPAPSVAVDDILSLVTAGPLAGPAPQTLNTPTAMPAPANEPRQRGWLAWAVGGGSALLAAAVAMAFVTIALSPGSLSTSAPGDVAMNQDNSAAREMAPELAARQSPAPKPGAPTAAAPSASAGAPPPPPVTSTLAKAEENLEPNDAGDVGQVSTETSVPLGGLIGTDADDAVADLGPDEDLPMEEEFLDDANFDLDELAEADEEAPADLIGGVETERTRPSVPQDLASAPAKGAAVRMEESVQTTRRGGEDRRKERRTAKDGKAKQLDQAGVSEKSDLGTLESRARPTQPVAGETLAVQSLLQARKYAEARDRAASMIQGGGLSNRRLADLHWVLGQAHQALGADADAAAAYTKAIRLR